ncbi:FadR/GntR family transcriptional regulator [Tepidiphilus margaritifer]|uniref:FadR/GntR family transcriptional regulator n=1 Tax=Tepidiphilus margaritifer TaxID=203471 RepID=UPI000A046EAF|nr:FadR/GntR family transcriptional regulator [Tepidiphilus margaritifer]
MNTRKKTTRECERVVQSLVEAILAGHHPRGARLPSEHTLCAKFGVSRAVVREAIAHLKAEGVVRARQGSGTYVIDRPGRKGFHLKNVEEVSVLEELRHILELRKVFETGVAELAAVRRTEADLHHLEAVVLAMDRWAQQAAHSPTEEGVTGAQWDDEFHLALARATHNPEVERFQEYLGVKNAAVHRVLWGRDGQVRGWPVAANAEHREILEAVRAGDPAAARRASERHLEGTADRVSEVMCPVEEPEREPSDHLESIDG